MRRFSSALALAASLFAMPAFAEKVDLNSLDDGIVAAPVSASGVTIRSRDGLWVIHDIFIQGDAVVAPYDAETQSAAADMQILFKGPVTDVSLNVYAVGVGDNVTINVWGQKKLKGSVTLTEGDESTIDLSSYGRVRRLLIDDNNSTSQGVGYGLINFTRVTPPSGKQDRKHAHKAAKH